MKYRKEDNTIVWLAWSLRALKLADCIMIIDISMKV